MRVPTIFLALGCCLLGGCTDERGSTESTPDSRDTQSAQAQSQPDKPPVSSKLVRARWNRGNKMILEFAHAEALEADLQPVICWGWVSIESKDWRAPYEGTIPIVGKVLVGPWMSSGLDVEFLYGPDGAKEMHFRKSPTVFVPFKILGTDAKGGILEVTSKSTAANESLQEFPLKLPECFRREAPSGYRGGKLTPQFVYLTSSPWRTIERLGYLDKISVVTNAVYVEVTSEGRSETKADE